MTAMGWGFAQPDRDDRHGDRHRRWAHVRRQCVAELGAARWPAPDPWDGATLEWASPSPPPAYNLDYTPVVDSLTPLWSRHRRSTSMSGLASLTGARCW
jgi:hypothetical protein